MRSFHLSQERCGFRVLDELSVQWQMVKMVSCIAHIVHAEIREKSEQKSH